MPISGKLIADFDSFHIATDKALGDLRSLEAGAGKVGPSLDRMTTQGTSGLTTFHQGLSQADKVLAAFGVRIGPEIQAIRELGDASSKTAQEIGLIGTAGLALGAGLAGWKVGRMIADFFDLDKTIADATAAMMGWGDVAGEEAGAKMDVLARATATAGREITDLTEAMRINAEEAANRFVPSFERFMQTASGAQREFRGLSEATRENMRTMLEAGATEKEVAAAFKVSAGAIDVLVDRDKLRAEQQKINIKLNDDRTAAELKLAKAIDTMTREEFRQLAAITASGKIIVDDVLPKVLQKENEVGVAVDDVTLRVRAQQAAWEAGQAQFNQEMNSGLVIIGQVGPATEGAAGQGAAALNLMTEAAIELGTQLKLAVPRDFSFEKAYSDAGFVVHGSLAGGNVHRGPMGGGGGTVTNNFNIIDTADNLARRVSDELTRNVYSGRKASI
jgi:hypothetical protein